MAKCPVCNVSKGKRNCRIREAWVCPQCCATNRDAEKCGDCGFFKPPSRDYNHLPRYNTGEMEDSDERQQISFPIEAAVCSLDREREFKLRDSQAIAIFELLLDIYAFGDSKEKLANRIDELGCASVVELVEKELRAVDRGEIVKVLGAVHFVARRRNIGGRHHMDVLETHCGAFHGPGLGLRHLSDGTDLVVNF